ncbi:MAG: AmmeMemoRadiSam system protein B [Ardenticatenaceae bacterium]|nr:AmmeMemoRadiSam system protein B [Ardenticatenaceae bacterium]
MRIRKTAVAGQFYPAQPDQLQAMIRGFLAQASGSGPTPKAIIAPHAGYRFSGPIAAAAYARLQGASFQRVLLLGPAHTVRLQGIAASSAEVFATPLGEVVVAVTAVQTSLTLPSVQLMDEAHLREHGLEVHLPFLQMVCPGFELVPFVVGVVETADLTHLLTTLYTPHTLIVISSDLSHYYDYHTAQQLDRTTSQAIEQLQPAAVEQACGRYPICGLLQFARQHHWQAQTIDLRNSGDTGGPRDRVVGYGAYIFS